MTRMTGVRAGEVSVLVDMACVGLALSSVHGNRGLEPRSARLLVGLAKERALISDALMVWFSFHGGHSGQYCRHAKGTLEEVVRTAIARGFTTYGLSEHCPRVDATHLYPDESDLSTDDLAKQFAAYYAEARELQRKYATQIELLVGFETEALPVEGWRPLMESLRRSPSFDYIVGSVHSVRGVWIDLSESEALRAERLCGGRENLEVEYFEQLRELIVSLRPEVVGHLDLIRRFRGSNVQFGRRTWERIEAVLEAARGVGAALEVNAAPMRRGFGPVYPSAEILARAQEMQVPVTLGDDSHGPADVGSGLDACLEAIRIAGYASVHYLSREEGNIRLCSAPLPQVHPRAVGGRRALEY